MESHTHCGPAPHNKSTFALSLFICLGLAISYAPQHYRIIHKHQDQRSALVTFATLTLLTLGKGFSAWYLLLGATSSASSLLNVVALQWKTPLGCLENALGILQIALQWFLFNLILIFFLIYFPLEHKYSVVTRYEPDATRQSHRASRRSWLYRVKVFFWPSLAAKSQHKRRSSDSSGSSEDEFQTDLILPSTWNRGSTVSYSHEFRLACVIAFITLLHLVIFAFVTLMLLITLPKSDLPIKPDLKRAAVHRWAAFLGVLSMLLACFQYIPQLVLTFKTRLVGSLSIPMMCIQTPGSFVFVYSYLAGGGRPGVNWTTWLVYLVTGILQGLLLLMCCAWKLRQKAAGVDDYGRDIISDSTEAEEERRPLLAGRRPSENRRNDA